MNKKSEKSDEKVDWIAEIRGLALMLLAKVIFFVRFAMKEGLGKLSENMQRNERVRKAAGR